MLFFLWTQRTLFHFFVHFFETFPEPIPKIQRLLKTVFQCLFWLLRKVKDCAEEKVPGDTGFPTSFPPLTHPIKKQTWNLSKNYKDIIFHVKLLPEKA